MSSSNLKQKQLNLSNPNIFDENVKIYKSKYSKVKMVNKSIMMIVKLFMYEIINKHTSHNHLESHGVSGRPIEINKRKRLFDYNKIE